MSKPLMKCGDVANATAVDGSPCCAIHAGLTPDAYIVSDQPLNLNGRLARCHCGKLEPSSLDLAFFEYRGEGSPHATTVCVCGFHYVAHIAEGVARNIDKRTVIDTGECSGFVARGAATFDSFYCGCDGWD